MPRVLFFSILLIFTSALIANHVWAGESPKFPPEFIEAAKKLNCAPKQDQPFTWGVLKGGKASDSGAFRCETKSDRRWTKMASIAIYVRDGSGLKFACPRLIPEQEYGEKLHVWEPGKNGKPEMPLSAFQIMGSAKFDTAKMGPKNSFVNGYVLEHKIADSVGVHFYCHGSKWLASYYE